MDPPVRRLVVSGLCLLYCPVPAQVIDLHTVLGRKSNWARCTTRGGVCKEVECLHGKRHRTGEDRQKKRKKRHSLVRKKSRVQILKSTHYSKEWQVCLPHFHPDLERTRRQTEKRRNCHADLLVMEKEKTKENRQ